MYVLVIAFYSIRTYDPPFLLTCSFSEAKIGEGTKKFCWEHGIPTKAIQATPMMDMNYHCSWHTLW